MDYLIVYNKNLFVKLWLAFSQRVTFRHDSIESVLIRISLSRGVVKGGGEAGGRHLPGTGGVTVKNGLCWWGGGGSDCLVPAMYLFIPYFYVLNHVYL